MSYADDINWRKSYGPKPGFALGTTGVGVVADHFTVDGYNIITRLTVNGVMPAITGTIAVGLLVYTFPAGVHSLKSGRIKIALTALDGNIDDDTPELGLGDTIASGAVATLGTTPAFENILTAQVAVCNGTVEDKAILQITAAHLMNEASGDKGVFLNLSDIWAGAEAALPITGEVWLEWTRLTSAEE